MYLELETLRERERACLSLHPRTLRQVPACCRKLDLDAAAIVAGGATGIPEDATIARRAASGKPDTQGSAARVCLLEASNCADPRKEGGSDSERGGKDSELHIGLV